ncbi:hypothetical protein FAIPA1_10352 [Frankia sp. AiPs1]
MDGMHGARTAEVHGWRLAFDVRVRGYGPGHVTFTRSPSRHRARRPAAAGGLRGRRGAGTHARRG